MSGIACLKRRFLSEHAAKRAHATAPYRIRPYFCANCGCWHVTANEKHARHTPSGDVPRAKTAKRQRAAASIAPVETSGLSAILGRAVTAETSLATLRQRITDEAARQHTAAVAAGKQDDPDAPERKRTHTFAAQIVESLLWE